MARVSDIQKRLGHALAAFYFASQAYRETLTFPQLGNLIHTDGVIDGGVWVPSQSGGYGVSLDGDNDFITLEDNLFDGRAEGSLVMHCLAVDPGAGNTARILGDFGGVDESFRVQATSTGGSVTFYTKDAGGVEALSSAFDMRWSEWITIGFEWGSAGKKSFLNGALIKAAAASTAGTLAGGAAPRIGNVTTEFAEMTCKALALFDRPIHTSEHSWLDRFFREVA